MPEPDDTAAAGTTAAADGRDTGSADTGASRAPSRRSMLQVAAGAGAAGIAATTLGGVSRMAARPGTRPDAGAELSGTAATEPLVLHLRDAASGEIDVFRGTTQTRVHDRDLAARMVRASHRRSASIATPYVPERTS